MRVLTCWPGLVLGQDSSREKGQKPSAGANVKHSHTCIPTSVNKHCLPSPGKQADINLISEAIRMQAPEMYAKAVLL